MGIFQNLFGKREPPEPPGKGLGPDYTAPGDYVRVPYTNAAYTYADDPRPFKQEQDSLAAGKWYHEQTGEPPEDWSGNNRFQKQALWPLEQLDASEDRPDIVPRKHIGADPRWNPPEYTGSNGRGVRSPSNWSFVRPFDVSSAKYLNGNKFSQAEILPTGYQYTGVSINNAGFRRNTYRTEAPPWDADIVDKPQQTQVTNASYTSPEPSLYGGRNYRVT